MIPHRKESSTTHNLSHCHANPLNPDHRPDWARTRLSEIRDAGLAVPECMQAYAAAHPAGQPLVVQHAPAVSRHDFQAYLKDVTSLVDSGAST